jgi:hypothetical protein
MLMGGDDPNRYNGVRPSERKAIDNDTVLEHWREFQGAGALAMSSAR